MPSAYLQSPISNLNNLTMFKPFILATLLLLISCTAAAQPIATPTPLPPAPALERPIYTVERGTVERSLTITGRVTPVDQERLSFRQAGRVAEVLVARGTSVRAGDLLAEIVHEEALEALAQAEARLAQAERALEQARQRREREIAQAQIDLGEANRSLNEGRAERADQLAEAELALQRAEEDLASLLSDDPDSLLRQAETALQEAQTQARQAGNEASEAKTLAENNLLSATEAVQAAQQAYSDAYWDREWVRKHGTHPREKVANPETGEQRHRDLEDHEKLAFERAYEQAERELAAAERALPLATREVELAREAEIRINNEQSQKVADAQARLDLLRAGQGNETLSAAQRRVEDARQHLAAVRRGDTASQETALARSRLGLSAAEQAGLESELGTVDSARLERDRAQRQVDEGRIVAPRDGVVIALAIGAGDTVEAYEPVIELADPTQLELAAELNAEQMRELAEGQAAEARLVARPDLALPALIRRLPAPYGSGGSGAVAEQDRSTRFQFTAQVGQLELGAVARISLVLERKEGVLWLPPEAIRSFEGRRFVVVRSAEGERRVPVRLGIASDTRVEIVEGLAEGETVVGP
jgi:HlyD family secretion protein